MSPECLAQPNTFRDGAEGDGAIAEAPFTLALELRQTSDRDSRNSGGDRAKEKAGINPPHYSKAGFPSGKCTRLGFGKYGSKPRLNHFLHLHYWVSHLASLGLIFLNENTEKHEKAHIKRHMSFSRNKHKSINIFR